MRRTANFGPASKVIHRYLLWGDDYEGPVPEIVFVAPEETQAFQAIRLHFREEILRLPAENADRKTKLVGRILECAINSASGASEPNDPAYWEIMETRAANAGAALKSSMKSLWQGDAIKNPRLGLWPRGRYMADALHSSRFGRPNNPIDIRRSHRMARQDVATLIKAAAILARLRCDAGRRRATTAAQRTNKGDVWKQHFVHILIEGWTFATGARPSSTLNEETNPFLRFACAAWADWAQENVERLTDVNFASALRTEMKSFSNVEFDHIRVNGPAWL